MRNSWQGKLWQLYHVACWGEGCNVEDEWPAGSFRGITRKGAIAYFERSGWRRIGRHWYCKDCVAERQQQVIP